MIYTITSKENSHVKEALSYQDGKGPLYLVEGFHLVEMALETGLLVSVFALKEFPGFKQDQYIVTDAIIKKLAFSKNPEGIIGVVKKRETLPCRSKRVLYLDHVSDPGNVGTLLRSALSFGFHDVIISEGSVSPYNPRAISASQGAIFKENLMYGAEALKDLKAQGFTLYGTDLKSSVPLSSIIPEAQEPLVLILGNEAQGVSPEILSLCPKKVRIEMEGIDSLNVAMAGSIIMYQWRLF